ncbi:hypothetical protein ACJMK2_028339 [Sinanodonta woodiana]|uniref:Uncharacterized protein n=1 Tax=Sinanodonta woodiana TaxID=1069815 RepID=A0ABD3X6T3_SINWO
MPLKRKSPTWFNHAVKKVQLTDSRIRSIDHQKHQHGSGATLISDIVYQATIDQITQQVVRPITTVNTTQVDNKLEHDMEMRRRTTRLQPPAILSHQGRSTFSNTHTERIIQHSVG